MKKLKSKRTITMQSNKKKQSSSKLRSFYLLCRSHLPCSNKSSTSTKLAISLIPISKKSSLPSHHHQKKSTVNSIMNETVNMHWQRVHELEQELVELEQWLGTELARLKRHLKSNINTSNSEPLCFTKVGDDQRNIKFRRLDNNGGYLYAFNSKRSCYDLVIQFSSPSLVPPEIGSNISEVLNQMAVMGKENLITWLNKSMPMIDLSMNKTQGIKISPCDAPNGLLEAILLKALKKLGYLVFEGLRIQMGVKQVVKQKQGIARRRSNNNDGEDCDGNANNDAVIIMAMLIQPRDSKKGYEAVNEMMIGFVEVVKNVEEDDEECGFCIKGIHVAGLVARKNNGQVIHNCLWYVSA